MIRVAKKGSVRGGEYIGRPSVLGNPFVLVSAGGAYTRDESVAAYRAWLLEKIAAKDRAVCAELNRLYQLAKAGDLTLVCYCAPLACHGDVVKEVLDRVLNRRREA